MPQEKCTVVSISHDQFLYLDNICVCSALMRFIVFCVFEKDLVHICAGILEQFVTRVENDQSNLTITEYTQFICFLHQSKFTLGKSNLGKGKRNKIMHRNYKQNATSQRYSLNIHNCINSQTATFLFLFFFYDVENNIS